jgi:hypothetical protein
MADKLFPTTITGFTEYIKVAYAKADTSLSAYGIAPDKFAPIIPLYGAYITAEAVAANPDTATSGARHTRNEAEKALKTKWRQFINECVRYNSAVPAADLEVFRLHKRDTTMTPAGTPDKTGIVSIRTAGARRMEIKVLDSETGKKKKPRYAAGSFVYVAVTEVGETPQHESDYRRQEFSSNCHHVIEFPFEQLAKQAHIYARYANAHGKEGPTGPVESAIIG